MKRILSFFVVFSLVVAVSSVFPIAHIEVDAALSISGGTLNSATFILDPGHGGSDPGAILDSRHEADDVLRLSKRVAELIIGAGETVAFTRTTDVDVSLANRCSIANSGSFTYFLSIHRNAGGGKGIETYYYSGSSSTSTGAKLATSVQNSMWNSGIWTSNRGVKTANFYVVKNTSMAAALAEVGFIDSTTDNSIFDANFETLAKSIANGLLAMVGKSVNTVVKKETGEYKMLGAVALRNSPSVAASSLVSVPTGEVLSVTEIIDNEYGYTQYGDYKGYIKLDNLVQRTGSLNTTRTAVFTCAASKYAENDYVVSWNDIPGAAGFACKIIQLDGEPDPGNSDEAANGTVLYDSTAYVTQNTSYTIPASSMAKDKYLKIAVRTTFPGSSTWSSMYVTPIPIPFTDVKADSWMFDSVRYCYENGLMSGVNATTFNPNGNATMAMMVVTAYRTAGSPAVSEDAIMPYSNASATAYYYNALLWCVDNDIIRVSETPTFDPNGTITREMAILCFYRMADRIGKNDKVLVDGALDGFSDVDTISPQCRVAMQWAVGKELISGNGTNLNPAGSTTRAQLAVILSGFDVFIDNVAEYYFPVKSGDIDNNGNVDASDYISLKFALKEQFTVADPFFEAADWNLDGDISSVDLISLTNYIKTGK